MNERIRELAAQAEMFANRGDHVDVKMMMEKFAELIVQECCDKFVELRTRPADLAALDVKEYFGMK